MPEAFRNLGQSAPTATTSTDLLTVPGSTEYVISTVVVCNTGAVDTSFRLSHAIGGVALAGAQYLFFDHPISAFQTVTMTVGLTLAATDKLRVYAANANLTFNAYGTAITP